MKILVTGGAGFIGSHVVDTYIQMGHEVIVVDNLYSGNIDNVNQKAKFYLADICSPILEKIFEIEKPDIVNHHAAQISVPFSVKNPLLDIETNVTGFVNLLNSCVKHKVKKIISISSGGAIYGEGVEYPSSQNCSKIPLSPYAINKMISESYLHYYNHQFNLNYTVLRYANVYGPRQVSHGEAGVVSIFSENILSKKCSTIYTFDNQQEGMIRDYIYVKDCVLANLLALTQGCNSEYNIGTGIETTTKTLYYTIVNEFNIDTEINNRYTQPIYKQARLGDIHRSLLNIKKAKIQLGWEPQYTLQNGIKQTVNYFKDKYANNL